VPKHLGQVGALVQQPLAFANLAQGLFGGCQWRFIVVIIPPLWGQDAHNGLTDFRGSRHDLSDAEWLADVAAHEMVRASFVPPARDP
jgi:hypothetical protein